MVLSNTPELPVLRYGKSAVLVHPVAFEDYTGRQFTAGGRQSN
ncbi:hypothetical protein AAFN47_10180 [Hoeflea sp. CAU 1731]